MAIFHLCMKLLHSPVGHAIQIHLFGTMDSCMHEHTFLAVYFILSQVMIHYIRMSSYPRILKFSWHAVWLPSLCNNTKCVVVYSKVHVLCKINTAWCSIHLYNETVVESVCHLCLRGLMTS